MGSPPTIAVDGLVDRYDVFLLDAYGVLVDAAGALPGAARLLEVLRARQDKQFVLLSNDASRLPSTTAVRYRRFGLDLRESDIITSGLVLEEHFRARQWTDVGCIVLGTEDSLEYVRRAGGRCVPFDDDQARVVVVADDDGYPFVEGIEQVITTLFRRIDRGEEVELVLPNPDRIYPKGDGAFGVASGSVAALIEGALAVRYPAESFSFVGLGKPHRPIFERALEHAGAPDRARVVMLGDQLGTDIRGAADSGIDSALVTTGLTRVQRGGGTLQPRPTWILDGLGEG